MLIDLLQRDGGATIDEIAAATGWQAHSVRGAISGTLKKKLGLAVSSEAVEGRGRVYRVRRLVHLAASGDPPSAGRATMRLQPGTRLMREWCGETQVVEVLENGFAWKGRTYRSLTAVARAITGVSWSGPRFFGLQARGRAKEAEQ